MNPPEPDELPCPQMLMGCTLALMTAYASMLAQSRGAATPPTAPLLARKVSCELFWLQQHPLVSPRLRQVAAQAFAQWQTLLAPTAAAETTADTTSARAVAPAAVLH